MPDLEVLGQRPNQLLVVGTVGDGHGHDDVPLIALRHIAQHLQIEAPPQGAILEVAGEEGGGQVFPDEEAGVLRVVHVGTWQTAVELIGRLGLARAKGPVEPDNHTCYLRIFPAARRSVTASGTAGPRREIPAASSAGDTGSSGTAPPAPPE